MRPLTQAEDEARRKLIRLWSSANHAQVKGCCLQAFQILTGREVLRTHRYWRLMMKRPVWSAQEALRRDETGIQAKPDICNIRLDDITLDRNESTTSATTPDATNDLHAHKEPSNTDIPNIELRHIVFCDDWLH